MKIAIDMMGGDFAPLEAVKGVKKFLAAGGKDVTLVLIGDQSLIEPLLKQYEIGKENISLVHSSQVIEMKDHPAKSLKEKPQSSISIGFQLLVSEAVDAFISAGNTGAMMVGALYSIKAIPGVSRPAIGAYIPHENGNLSLLIDVGLNADCKPDNLSQFAILGSLFCEHILGYEHPRVAMVNIGAEETKGNLLSQAAYPLLKENASINFIGNAEGRDILMNKADAPTLSVDSTTGETHVRHRAHVSEGKLYYKGKVVSEKAPSQAR
jgi:glycerol-3-phosphate acyltransferase PlsX